VFGEGDLAGDVGQDGAPAVEQAGVVVEAGQGGEFDVQVDHAAPVGRPDAAAGAQVGRADRRAVQVVGSLEHGQPHGGQLVIVVAGP
jgi:hypothetical protein